MERMNREQFYAKLGPLSREELQKVLWTLYWRGTAAMRERIEAETTPTGTVTVKHRQTTTIDPQLVLLEVEQFVELARAGSYLAGDRRVRPKERTQWRFTFKRLVTEARDALRSDDPAAATAVETLIDLANDMRRHNYFRSEDAVEAAGIVVSDEVALLWTRMLERDGLTGFCATATAQLIRWESRYGWTVSGYGKVAAKEVPLATVLANLLPVPDAWTVAADSYLDALDRCAPVRAAIRQRTSWRSQDYELRERTESLALWHKLLFDRFAGSDEEDRLDRLTTHPSLDGPELVYLQARLAHHRGDIDRAHKLASECSSTLPGHKGFRDFAAEIGAPPSTR
jgi:hypothetical protein